MSKLDTDNLDWAVGVACLEAFADREGHTEVPRDHCEPITPDILRKAADTLEEDPSFGMVVR